jgi:hypothetical protein
MKTKQKHTKTAIIKLFDSTSKIFDTLCVGPKTSVTLVENNVFVRVLARGTVGCIPDVW